MDGDLMEQARAFARDGRYEAALGLFREAGGAEGAYGEAGCLYKLGRFSEAWQANERCLAFQPNHQKAYELRERLQADTSAAEHILSKPTSNKGKANFDPKASPKATCISVGCSVFVIAWIAMCAGIINYKPDPQRTAQYNQQSNKEGARHWLESVQQPGRRHVLAAGRRHIGQARD